MLEHITHFVVANCKVCPQELCEKMLGCFVKLVQPNLLRVEFNRGSPVWWGKMTTYLERFTLVGADKNAIQAASSE